jgi:hypothetical protein
MKGHIFDVGCLDVGNCHGLDKTRRSIDMRGKMNS